MTYLSSSGTRLRSPDMQTCALTGRTCSWCSWNRFSADNYLLLLKKQRKLQWLETMFLDRDILPDLKRNEKMQTEAFQHVRMLNLSPVSRETLRLSQLVIQKTKDLEVLFLHPWFPNSPDQLEHGPPYDEFIQPRVINDSATAPGLLTGTLFSHMMPFESCEPFRNLKSLRLDRISLRYCADTWCKIVDFTNVEYLSVFDCPGADSLFGQLSKSNNLPRLLSSLEFQHRDNAENEALLALDGFLCLVSGIGHLTIDLDSVKSLPAAAGIVRQSKTLGLLSVHGWPASSSTSGVESQELIWDTEDFEKICTACTRLEQVSCAWPKTSLIRSPTLEWMAFERSCSSLRKIVTLHISTWPSNSPSTQTLPRSIYKHLLQVLAQRAFDVAAVSWSYRVSANTTDDASSTSSDEKFQTSENLISSPSLRLVAFGNSDKIDNREDSKTQLIYLRSAYQDSEGRSKIYAAPIGWCLRRYVEPRSDVLDFRIYRKPRPPCREGGLNGGAGLGWGEDDE